MNNNQLTINQEKQLRAIKAKQILPADFSSMSQKEFRAHDAFLAKRTSYEALAQVVADYRRLQKEPSTTKEIHALRMGKLRQIDLLLVEIAK